MNSLQNKKTLWISIYHPGEIISAVGMSLLVRDKYTVNLLIKDHPYWKGMGDDFYKKYFDNIYHFPDVGFSKHFLREVLKIIHIKKILKKLAIKDDDIYLTFSNKSFVDNIFLSAHRRHRIIKVVYSTVCFGSLSDFLSKNKYFKEIFTSKIWNLTIIPLFRLQPVVYLQHEKDRSLYEIVYKSGDAKIFGELYFISDYDKDVLGSNEIYNFMPLLKEKLIRGSSGKDKIIIFFGEGRDRFDQYHCDFTNKCLRYIEHFFPGYHLVYKPHPIDFNGFETNNIVPGKFEIYRGGDISELLLLENFERVEACFSISSTSLRRAVDLGIKSYYFMDLYKNYLDDYRAIIKNLIGNLRSEAWLKSFEIPPLLYLLENNNLEKFSKHINKLPLLSL